MSRKQTTSAKNETVTKSRMVRKSLQKRVRCQIRSASLESLEHRMLLTTVGGQVMDSVTFDQFDGGEATILRQGPTFEGFDEPFYSSGLGTLSGRAKLGIEYGYEVNGGSATVQNVLTYEYETTTLSSDWVDVDFSKLNPMGKVSTQSPSISAYVDLVAKGHAHYSLDLGPLGHVNPSLRIDETMPLLSVNRDNDGAIKVLGKEAEDGITLSFLKVFDATIRETEGSNLGVQVGLSAGGGLLDMGNMRANVPSINLNGWYQPGETWEVATGGYFHPSYCNRMHLQQCHPTSEAIGIDANLGLTGEIPITTPFGTGTIRYTAFNYKLEAGLNVGQVFKVSPHHSLQMEMQDAVTGRPIDVDYRLNGVSMRSVGGKTVSFTQGADLEISPDASPIVVTPRASVSYDVSNDIDLILKLDGTIQALNIGATYEDPFFGTKTDLGETGFAVNESQRLGQWDFDAFQPMEYTVSGGVQSLQSFTIEGVQSDPVPDPRPEDPGVPVNLPAPEPSVLEPPAPLPISTCMDSYVSLNDGKLSIQGTNRRDKIETVRGPNERGALGLAINGCRHTFEAGEVDSVMVKAGGGNDRIRMLFLPRGVTTAVHGGDGNDNVIGGNAADLLIGGMGDDTIQGRAGRDLLVAGDVTSAHDQVLGNWANHAAQKVTKSRVQSYIAHFDMTHQRDRDRDKLIGGQSGDHFMESIEDAIEDRVRGEFTY